MMKGQRIRVYGADMNSTLKKYTIHNDDGIYFSMAIQYNKILFTNLPLEHGKYLHAQIDASDNNRCFVWESDDKSIKENINKSKNIFIWKEKLSFINLLREIKNLYK